MSGFLVAQLWNAHMAVLHVQMDLAPAPAMSGMFQRFTVEHRVKVTEATAGAESATASFLILTGRKLDILPAQTLEPERDIRPRQPQRDRALFVILAPRIILAA
jgi:hypothetical protein